MCDHESRAFEERGDLEGGDTLAANHFVRNSGQRCDLARDRAARIPQLVESCCGRHEGAVDRIVETQHGEFDDLIGFWIQACRLRVDEDPPFDRYVLRGASYRTQAQPTKNTILAGGLEPRGEAFEFHDTPIGPDGAAHDGRPGASARNSSTGAFKCVTTAAISSALRKRRLASASAMAATSARYSRTIVTARS